MSSASSPYHLRTISQVYAEMEGTLCEKRKIKKPMSKDKIYRYSSTTLPHTSLSRWIVYVGTLRILPSLKYLPITTNPPGGTILGNPIALYRNRNQKKKDKDHPHTIKKKKKPAPISQPTSSNQFLIPL